MADEMTKTDDADERPAEAMTDEELEALGGSFAAAELARRAYQRSVAGAPLRGRQPEDPDAYAERCRRIVLSHTVSSFTPTQRGRSIQVGGRVARIVSSSGQVPRGWGDVASRAYLAQNADADATGRPRMPAHYDPDGDRRLENEVNGGTVEAVAKMPNNGPTVGKALKGLA